MPISGEDWHRIYVPANLLNLLARQHVINFLISAMADRLNSRLICATPDLLNAAWPTVKNTVYAALMMLGNLASLHCCHGPG